MARPEPEGRADQLVAALGGQFHPDYGPVLRGMLFAIDRERATGKSGTGHRKVRSMSAGTVGTHMIPGEVADELQAEPKSVWR